MPLDTPIHDGQMDVWECIDQAAADAAERALNGGLTADEAEAEYLATCAGHQDYLNDEVYGEDN